MRGDLKCSWRLPALGGSFVPDEVHQRLDCAAAILAAWRDLRRGWSLFVTFELAFKLLEAWLLTPAIAVALAMVMSRAGHVAVSDWDILDFLLTPIGLIYAGLFAGFAAALILLQHSGAMILASWNDPAEKRIPSESFIPISAALTNRIFQLGLIKLGLLVLTLVPFIALLGLTHFAFLSQHDINFYLSVRPPAYWFAVSLGGMVILAAAIAGVALAVHWSFALPILLFERTSPRDALKASGTRVAGIRVRIACMLMGWQFIILLMGTALGFGFHWVATRLPAAAAESPRVLLLLLIARGVLFTGLSAAGTLGHALLTRQLYLAQSRRLGLTPLYHSESESPLCDAVPARIGSQFLLGLAVLAGLPFVIWVGLLQNLSVRPEVLVTAHRGHARAAPENTLSALRAAIHSGADYAEIDVQLTADGQAVLLHDRDLMRVAGDPRQLENLNYAELQQLEVGSWFSPAFVAERVPTLSEAIELARGRIKLNIELKFYGDDRGLARKVSQILREATFEGDCIVTSFNQQALLDVRRANSSVRTGVIIATAVGDVTRLEGEVLSVRADWLSDSMMRSAKRRGREVHVWTVNDERQMVRLMMRGVDNILTSDPDLLISVRKKWSDLTDAEELLLAARILLELE